MCLNEEKKVCLIMLLQKQTQQMILKAQQYNVYYINRGFYARTKNHERVWYVCAVQYRSIIMERTIKVC